MDTDGSSSNKFVISISKKTDTMTAFKTLNDAPITLRKAHCANPAIKTEEPRLQSSTQQRRRYMRRGSQCPSMLMRNCSHASSSTVTVQARGGGGGSDYGVLLAHPAAVLTPLSQENANPEQQNRRRFRVGGGRGFFRNRRPRSQREATATTTGTTTATTTATTEPETTLASPRRNSAAPASHPGSITTTAANRERLEVEQRVAIELHPTVQRLLWDVYR
jgi:hypothetical protein